ncbi:LuxR C-terminal-related transcriptional regulator [Rhodococcus sp. IEGM 1379]|uniref:LuxR C-terminal-related transcriptional regulator n=1 Tax=Rhodococcus sp. IEGM 1379 TaxID=3047086 RepID=UPI0024B824A0|nr:LuxR C-terminal-related transcriptional regulator [Rhodococcus sp. IEGM 1379]MDI9916569.1 LuxR C-terminal-related transcriptional regulator [Rhodococcus sp. IEGM 1379]
MNSSVRVSDVTAPEPGASVPEQERQSRFRPPSAIANVISRPRLHRQLSATTHTRMVSLLCAPAGAGKTLLLADWAREQSHTSVSWLTLAERDNNAHVLCTSLSEALSEHVEPVARGAPPQFWLSSFMDAIEASGRPITLILDDVHALHDPISITTLDHVLAQAPPNLSIVIAARYEPPLTWHRLTLHSRLVRFEASDLAFNSNEITTLLGEYAISLTDDQLAIIESFTKGWGAVVRLAGAYLCGRGDTSDAVEEFTHTPRPVADFLVDEVLAALPPHLTTFMLRTSVVDAFSIDLAEALIGVDAGTEIDALIQFNLPLTRTDSPDHTTWFSYHPLLREHLRAEFRRVDPGGRLHVNEQAATWLETHQHEVEALELEIGIGDTARILAFLDHCGLGIVLDGYSGDLVRILESAPIPVTESPCARMLLAASALHSGDVTTASTYLNFLGTASPLHNDILCRALTLETLYATAGSRCATTLSALAHRQHSANSDIEAYAHLQVATGYFLNRDFGRAAIEYTQAAALGTLRGRSRLVLKSLTGLGFVAALDGNVEAMTAHSTYALDYAVEHQLTGTAEYELSTSVAALAAYLCDTTDLTHRIPTLQNYRQADILGIGIPAFGWHTVITFGLHRLDTADDRRATVSDTRDALLSAIDSQTFPIASSALLPAVVNTCLSVGELDWASRLIHDVSRQIGEVPEVHLARASLRLAGSRYAEAQIELDAASEEHHRPLLGHSVYASVMQSCIHSANRQPRKAFHSLHNALRVAEHGNLLRPFLDYGHSLRRILDDFSGHFGDQEPFAEHVRARLQPQELIRAPILTPGEYTVLRELASGDTTESIASTLFLSVNTIKTHLRGIYRKLDVSNRRDALKAARRGGLI